MPSVFPASYGGNEQNVTVATPLVAVQRVRRGRKRLISPNSESTPDIESRNFRSSGYRRRNFYDDDHVENSEPTITKVKSKVSRGLCGIFTDGQAFIMDVSCYDKLPYRSFYVTDPDVSQCKKYWLFQDTTRTVNRALCRRRNPKEAVFVYDAKSGECRATFNRASSDYSDTMQGCENKRESKKTCEGHVLESSDRIGFPEHCRLIEKSSGKRASSSVTCSAYTPCFMVHDEKYCRQYRNGKWKIAPYYKCDISGRISRAVEQGILPNGEKRCTVETKVHQSYFGNNRFSTIKFCTTARYIIKKRRCKQLAKAVKTSRTLFLTRNECETEINRKKHKSKRKYQKRKIIL